MSTKQRVFVIGAGPAGLSILKALKALPQQNYEIVCIEKQPDWSGQWNYTWRSTTDKYGQHVHSSMYSQLWTNSPKQALQFADYTFEQHFGKSVPSYLPRQIFKEYFMKRFQREGLRKYIKFNCVARNVEYLQEDKRFRVRYTELDNKKDIIELFDYIVVASGHFSYPNLPDFKGIQLFKGKVSHSHQLRQFNEFKDHNVLVIGGSFSAEDVSLQCFKYGAKNITWAYRKMQMQYNLQNIPRNIELISGLSHFDEHNVHFQNGESRQIDDVLLCTGYIHHYPFMEQNLRLDCEDQTALWPKGLYQSLVLQKNPRVFYVGAGSYRLSLFVFDVQGYLIKDIILGKHIVPEDILTNRHQDDIKRDLEVENAKNDDELMVSAIKYISDLMNLTDYPKFDVEKFIPIYVQNLKDRQQNFVTYRDIRLFQSIHTGQWSCKANRTWLQMKEVEPTNPKSKEQIQAYFEF